MLAFELDQINPPLCLDLERVSEIETDRERGASATKKQLRLNSKQETLIAPMLVAETDLAQNARPGRLE